MTKVNPAFPSGAHPPPGASIYNQGQTQFGQPLGAQYGQSMSTQYGQPIGTQYGQPIGTQYGQSMGTHYGQSMGQTATNVVVIQHPGRVNISRVCPHCQSGVVSNQPTVLGLILCFIFFPIGIICCMMMTERRCSRCKAKI